MEMRGPLYTAASLQLSPKQDYQVRSSKDNARSLIPKKPKVDYKRVEWTGRTRQHR